MANELFDSLGPQEQAAFMTLATSPLFLSLIEKTSTTKNTTADAMQQILKAAPKEEAEKFIGSFKVVHDVFDKMLDDRLGLSISEVLHFRRALDKAAVSYRKNTKNTNRSFVTGPDYVLEPSALLKGAMRSEEHEFFVQGLKSAVDSGRIPPEVAKALAIAYSSPVLSEALVAAALVPNLTEKQAQKVIEGHKDKQAVVDASWAINTIQQFADAILEGDVVFSEEGGELPQNIKGVSVSELLRLRDVLYDFAFGEEGKALHEKWWFWPAVVVAVAVLILIVIIVSVSTRRKKQGGGVSNGKGEVGQFAWTTTPRWDGSDL